MPVPEIKALNKASSAEQTRAAISSCIATEVKAGTPRDQAIAMCHKMARERGAPVAEPEGGK